MSHKAQRDYIRTIRSKFPKFFKEQFIKVLDIGSQDINGNNRRFLSSQFYIGCDLEKGKNVDIISKGHKLTFRDSFFDFIISCECFEHDECLPSTLVNIIRMLRPGGLFVFTCATTGRKEHGTARNNKNSSPFTNNFYKNVTEEALRSYIPIDDIFEAFEFTVLDTDLRFYGIKK
jgi:SAM-dependent methyltransferase